MIPADRSLISRMALFLLIFCVLFFLLETLYDKAIVENIEIQYDTLSRGDQNFTTVILGTSRSRVGINPKYLECFDRNVYNFSQDGNSYVSYRSWHKKIFKGYFRQAPKTVLLCIDWDMFQPVSRRIEHDCEYWPWGLFLKSLFDPEISKRALFMNRWAVIKTRHSILKRLMLKNPEEPHDFKEAYKGYLPFTHRVVPQSEKGRKPPTARKRQVYSDEEIQLKEKDVSRQIATLPKILDDLLSDGAKIILIRIPEFMPEMIYGIDRMRDSAAFLEEIAKSKNLLFLDYFNTAALTESERKSHISYLEHLFFDIGHLNLSGSTAFSRVLWEDLNKILPRNGQCLSKADEASWAGDSYNFLGQYAKSVQFYKEAIEADPTRFEAYQKLGSLFVFKDYRINLDYALKAVQLNPESPPVQITLGDTYCKLGQYDKALTAYENAVRLDPKLPLVLNEIVKIYFAKREFSQALTFVQKSIQIDPDNPRLYLNLGAIHVKLNQYREAIEVYRKASHLDHFRYEPHQALGEIYMRMKDYKSALSHFKRSIKINPNDVVAHMKLGEIYDDLGKTQLANEMRRRVEGIRGHEN